jgi:hypothetical protein
MSNSKARRMNGPSWLPWNVVATIITLSAGLLLWALFIYALQHMKGVAGGESVDNFASLVVLATAPILFVLIGWRTLRSLIEESVKAELDQRIALLEKQFKGRSLSALGYMLGELSLHSDIPEPRDHDRLAVAVTLCQQGYDLLKSSDHSSEFLGLNNLVFYSCLSEDISKKAFLLEQSRRLKAAGQEHSSPTLLLTACRVFLEHGTEEEQIEAREILTSLKDGRIHPMTEKEKKEAQHYLAPPQTSALFKALSARKGRKK